MRKFLLLLSFLYVAFTLPAQEKNWQTYYEQSGMRETPRYAATIEFCRRLAQASPMITFTTFGRSGQGRDLPLLILDRDGLSDPEAIRSKGRIILLIQACIHAGESEGKDAGLMLMRDMAIDQKFPELTQKVSIALIPIFNTDGHERFGKFNRINQNGPAEMGWRTTASNLNLNRDYLKADAPEMKSWLKLFNRWMPEFFIDTHTTDGADYQYVLTYLIEIYGSMDEGLTKWARDNFIPGMEHRMQADGFPVFPYVGFRNWHDPRSGLITEIAPPMLSQGYTALRNRPGLLIETHMLKPYRQRVESTYDCIVISLGILNREADKLKNLIKNADELVSSQAFLQEPFPLRFETLKDDSIMVDFRGFQYEVVRSDLTGGEWFRYSNDTITFRLPYFSSAKPVSTAILPLAYIIPAEYDDVISRLKLHGIKMTELKAGTTVPVVTCRFRNPKWQQNPYEGRHPMTNIEFEEISEQRYFAPGSAMVEVMQPAGRIIPHILEPRGNGSYLYWGFFDASFEQKEYGESYVVEKMAREMLAGDPVLRQEFEKKMSSDTVFARSPQMILNWFYNKSPYTDSRKGIYPVGKLTDPAMVEELRHR